MEFIKETIIYLFKQLTDKDQLDTHSKLNDLLIKNREDSFRFEQIYELSWY